MFIFKMKPVNNSSIYLASNKILKIIISKLMTGLMSKIFTIDSIHLKKANR